MASPGGWGMQMMSLHELLGRLDSITVVVDSFVARCVGDDRINRSEVML
jgi:hypothetical protein